MLTIQWTKSGFEIRHRAYWQGEPQQSPKIPELGNDNQCCQNGQDQGGQIYCGGRDSTNIDHGFALVAKGLPKYQIIDLY